LLHDGAVRSMPSRAPPAPSEPTERHSAWSRQDLQHARLGPLQPSEHEPLKIPQPCVHDAHRKATDHDLARGRLGQTTRSATATLACIVAPAGRAVGAHCHNFAPAIPANAAAGSGIVHWTGGTERTLVVDGYAWNRLPGNDVEVRALTDKPLALRYRRPRHHS
jgi:hypothetical protein